MGYSIWLPENLVFLNPMNMGEIMRGGDDTGLHRIASKNIPLIDVHRKRNPIY
jgi:hypothetical protein